MKTEAQVVVIGGGVVGASVLYHLAKAGWTDVVLVERRELTAGSTWHSAGGMHTLNGDPNVAALQKYTVELYREIEEMSGQDCGIHLTGGLVLADTEERMDWLRMAHARGRYLGMDTELLSPAEAKDRVPYMDEKYFVGAMFDAHEGHIDPSGVTHAYAKCAQMLGAEVYRFTWANRIERASDGGWDIAVHDTRNDEDLGSIHCEHFVNAGGLWAREVGRMTGLELPVLAMEHMYLLTEPVPDLVEWNQRTGKEGLHAMDLGGEIYMRQEGDGLLLGTYERHGVPWSPRETPWDFGSQLLAPDLDRIAENLDVGFAHFPIFNEIGIKQVINGPFTFTPDGNPLVGPIRGQHGAWTACGVMAGLSQGGGVGLSLANWMIEGDPGFDVWGMDVSRYGEWATPRYTNAKVRENYGRRFRITFPNEELPAARRHITSPIYDRLDAKKAVWGAAYGLEYALWFQSDAEEAVENVTFRRSNAFDRVAEESAAVRTGVGVTETTGFAKFEFWGHGARAWLSRVVANTIPKVGRLALTPMLNDRGKLVGDVTVGALEDDRFIVFGSGVAERHYERWFTHHLPADGSVQFRTCGNELTGLSIAGPNARDLLDDLTDDDVSTDAFRFLDIRRLFVDTIPALVGRISFTGDLGYEIWVPAGYQTQLFDVLQEAGQSHGLRLFGARALNSLRLEKGFGSWATEFRPIYNPYEANLDMFVKVDKAGGFIGREASVATKASGPQRRLCTWVVETDDADVIGDEPIWHDDKVVGWVTSGGYAHWSKTSLALGYIPDELSAEAEGFEIEIVGVRRQARLLTEVMFDPSGSRMRA
ncbi:MAG: FAD-dependent oxidoreductase [Acidimicrobiales bacterium]